MNQLLLIPIVAFAKLLTLALRVSGRGSGTALPGYLVGKYFPFVLESLVSKFPPSLPLRAPTAKPPLRLCSSAMVSQVEGPKFCATKRGLT
jgi:hypothetical protein